MTAVPTRRLGREVIPPVRGRNRTKGQLPPEPIRSPFQESAFCAWVAQAAPGDEAEYHRGFLILDLTPFGNPMDREARTELACVAARARDLAERGFIHLVQRRIAPGSFAYLAIARPHRGPRPIPSALLLEEAA